MKIKATMLKGLSKAGMRLRKSSPEILLAAGITGTVVSTILACRATVKAGDILEEHRQEMDDIHELAHRDDIPDEEKDIPQLTTNQYVRTGVGLIKLYAPSVILMALSIASIAESHSVMRRRNLALTAAISSANLAFQEYRDKVRKEIGDEYEQMIFDGGQKVIEKVAEVDDDGKTHTKAKTKIVYHGKPSDPYALLFDESNKNWEKTEGWNQMFVKKQLEFAQSKLDSRGWITLNEVYDLLDAEPIEDGFVVGWSKYDKQGNHRVIDFGLNDARLQDFADGNERSAWLTFNVDKEPLGYGLPDKPVARLM